MTFDSAAAPMLEAAQEYASRGIPVFPVWGITGGRCDCGAASCQAGKHPLGALVPNGLLNATTDAETIRGWWTRFPNANIATPTTWCVVLDVDVRKGGDQSLAALEEQHGPGLPDTPEVLTGGGGRHLYFERAATPIRNSAEQVGPGLDVRGEGGYVLLPPSRHASGRAYADELSHPLFESKMAPIPDWLLALMVPAASVNGSGPPQEAVDWAALLTGAPKGQRHAVALKIAGHYLGKRVDPDEVEKLLLLWTTQCVPPFDEADVRRIVRDLAAKDAARAPEPAKSADAEEADGPILTRLSTVAPEPVAWLWPGRFARGKLGLVIGEPGDGKSTLTTDVGARTTRGLTWPDGGAAVQGAVILLAAEDGLADTVRPRVDRQGGDAAKVYVLRAVRRGGHESPFSFERDLAALETAIRETLAVLIIVDPLSAYLGSKDSYKDAEVRALLTPLAALAERYNVAILAVLHLTKSAQRKILLRAQASIAFVAQARTVLAVGVDPEQPARRLMLTIKNNLGPFAPGLAFRITDAGLRWDAGTVAGTAEDLLAVDEPGSRSDQRTREAAVRFLREALADGPMSSKELMKDAKANVIAWRTLERAKADLGIVAEKQGTGGWYWSLPHSEPTT